MDTYRILYFKMFNALSDIHTAIMDQNYGVAKRIAEEAQREAERIYIETEEWASGHAGM